MPMQPILLHEGDVYRHVMAGGGGYGDPYDRDPERVRADVLDGKVTVRHARDAYGVVLREEFESPVDIQATLEVRASRRAAMGSGGR
jgi:N-methylhydantoinase B